ncbi:MULTISPECIES: PDR/VanB family oxidoreductase [unclassified Curtobacterium]|uniref:PDR/VanB family oxidoreductase n=1 Tax=unclassified Curtobacterium TaxID=257496 RepID=UPI000DAAA998|nr:MULTISPECIES: PDR/VanB family oxidoreductase [unclassified Curtobacterium]PZE33360.1 oxidoreductase [Curtobacterium sp. MCPF17_031]PZF13928.1 oxidoreductase [Curtobacterium sp. MCPF17_011]
MSAGLVDSPDDRLRMRIADRQRVAEDVVVLDLASVDGVALPEWEPGAHVDLEVAPGIERQYSLVTTTPDGHWRVAVLREASGRGGSVAVHDTLRVDDEVLVGGPRNHFGFDPDRPAVFVAGGIGITPIRAMIAAAEAGGTPWELHYAGRTRDRMAFADELVVAHPDRVALAVADDGTRIDVASLLAVPRDAVVYCCGPRRLMDAVEAAAAHWPAGSVRVERFEPAADVDAPRESFEVELTLTGVTVTVPADRTLLEVAEDAGAFVLSSCREGTCGTCETPVLDGAVDHRDTVLSPAEQADDRTMMVCVSRARRGCPRLVLEL